MRQYEQSETSALELKGFEADEVEYSFDRLMSGRKLHLVARNERRVGHKDSVLPADRGQDFAERPIDAVDGISQIA